MLSGFVTLALVALALKLQAPDIRKARAVLSTGQGMSGASVPGDRQWQPPHQHVGPLCGSSCSYLTSGLRGLSEWSQEQAHELEQGLQRR